MERLKCYCCNQSRPAEDFAWRRKERSQRDSFCRPCRSAYDKERKEAIRLERTRFLVEFFRSHPCVDCGERDPVMLEFDHLGDKAFPSARSSPSSRGRRFSTRSKSVKSSALTATDVERRGVVARYERSSHRRNRAGDRNRTDSFSLEG